MFRNQLSVQCIGRYLPTATPLYSTPLFREARISETNHVYGAYAALRRHSRYT